MQFLFPAGAWAFAALLVIAALYLLKRRSQPFPVPSLLLWQRALAEQQAMRPFQKLKKNILLFLQLALAALLAVSLMRPAVSGGVQGESVFIFDLSASMQTVEGGESRLEMAKRRAAALVDGMGEGDRVTVIAAGSRVETRLSRSGDLNRVRAALNALQAENGGADLDAAVSLAQAMARETEGLNIIVFSDTYTHPAVQVARAGSGADNRALLSVSVSDSGQVFARVANYGAAADVTLECSANGALCDMVSLSLDEGETRAALLQAPTGAQTYCVSLAEPDALAADNRRWAAVRETGELRAALCGDSIFLEKAAALRNDLSLLRTTPEDVGALTDIDLYIFDGALPDVLPAQGALLCVAPDREVPGIAPGEAVAPSGAVKAGYGSLARQLTEHLFLEELALRQYTPLTGGEAVLTCDGNTLLSAVETNDRRVAVLGFDLHDSNLPMLGDFPVLIQNLLAWLLPAPQQALADGLCGASVALPLDARAESVTVTLPGGRSLAADRVLEETAEQGVYTVTYAYADRGSRSLRFALHMDTAESDVRQTADDSLTGPIARTQAAGRDLTVYVLAAFFALLLIEWGVSRRVA